MPFRSASSIKIELELMFKLCLRTGLGDRIALNVIRAVGGTTLGLAYGLNAAELLVAAAMPCSAARVGRMDSCGS